MRVLGVLPPLGGGLQDLSEAGQLGRLFDAYIPAWLSAFDRIEFFSHFDERIEEFTGDAEIRRRVTVRARPPAWPRRLWATGMAFHHTAAIRRCSVLRVLQITGVLPAVAAKRLWGVPFVATYGYRYAQFARVVERRPLKAGAMAALERIGLATADAIIVTTPALARAVGRKSHLIPNGVDATAFAPAKRRKRGRRVAFVGRLEPQKNIERLIEAVKRVPDAHLTLIGDGALKAGLQARGGAEFLGAVPHAELPKHLGAADAFALPSLIEGHPKALLEAMACGLPCVASRREGCADVIDDGVNGLLCDPLDVGDIARQIARALDDGDLASRLGAAARAKAEAEYDLRALLKREVDLLRSLSKPRV